MLSDHEQRALDELERSFTTEAPRLSRAGRSFRRWNGPPGSRTAACLGIVCIGLVIVGVPVAGLALATATALVWLYWRLWSQRWELAGILSPPVGGGGLLRHYLGWLFQRPSGR